MAMTVRELIDHLSDYDPDAEVRLAHQPEWPFEYSVQSVASAEEAAELREPDPDEDNAAPANVVYIAEGEQLGYLPEFARAVWAIS
jgi:hypothetical protein